LANTTFLGGDVFQIIEAVEAQVGKIGPTLHAWTCSSTGAVVCSIVAAEPVT
jgi:hypothetical protein